ncbi:MAG: hypothetical protein ACFFCW_04515 [Candidatus Hodarchaeota archaeon]
MAEEQRGNFAMIIDQGFFPLLQKDPEIKLPRLPKDEGVIVAATPNVSLGMEESGRDFIAASAGVTQGFWIHGGHLASRGSVQKVDAGDLFLTNHRIIFMGEKRTVNINMGDLLGVYFDESRKNMSMRVHVKDKETAYLFYHPILMTFKVVMEALNKEEWRISYDEKGEPLYVTPRYKGY